QKRGAPFRGAPLRGQTRRGRRVDDSEVGAQTKQDLVDITRLVVVEAGFDVDAGAGAEYASQVDVDHVLVAVVVVVLDVLERRPPAEVARAATGQQGNTRGLVGAAVVKRRVAGTQPERLHVVLRRHRGKVGVRHRRVVALSVHVGRRQRQAAEAQGTTHLPGIDAAGVGV